MLSKLSNSNIVYRPPLVYLYRPRKPVIVFPITDKWSVNIPVWFNMKYKDDT